MNSTVIETSWDSLEPAGAVHWIIKSKSAMIQDLQNSEEVCETSRAAMNFGKLTHCFGREGPDWNTSQLSSRPSESFIHKHGRGCRAIAATGQDENEALAMPAEVPSILLRTKISHGQVKTVGLD